MTTCIWQRKRSLLVRSFPRGGLLGLTVGEALREALTELLAAHEL